MEILKEHEDNAFALIRNYSIFVCIPGNIIAIIYSKTMN